MNDDAPILWLASWYPNRLDPFTGDFIQRHARAVSMRKKIHVIFLRRDRSLQPGSLYVETRNQGILTEDIGYYNSRGSSRLLSLFYFLAACRKLILAFLANQGRPSLVHVHVGLRAGVLAVWLKKRYGIPYVLTEHWTGYNPEAEDSIWKQGRIARWIAAAIFRNAALVMPVSTDLGKQIAAIEPAAEIQVINNVVDTSIFNFRPKNPLLPYTFMHASSLSAQKYPEHLLKAFRVLEKYPNWRLVVAGPAASTLRKLAADLGIGDRIEWTGEISYEEVARAMQRSDCFVLSSRYENSPCVIGEALCCGVPVISTDVGGISELVGPGDGLLVESGNLEALQDAILKVYRQQMQWIPEKIAADSALKYSYPVIGGLIEKIYAHALSNAGK